MNDGGRASSITVFAGRFGSGKTEAAINYALQLAQRSAPETAGRERTSSDGVGNRVSPLGGVILVDLDIVTPYFRTREMADSMRAQGVAVVSPSVIGQHLDTPAITPQILGAIEQRQRHTVLDVGGDRQGARVLGGLSSAIDRRGYEMHFVVNPYRPFTQDLASLEKSVREIQDSARLKVTSLVSNPNLIGETTPGHILKGHSRVEGFARELGLPIAFVCLERRWVAELGSNHFVQPVLILDRFFVHPWEETP